MTPVTHPGVIDCASATASSFEYRYMDIASVAGAIGTPKVLGCYIIGSGTLLIQCAGLLLRAGHRICGVLSDDEAVRRWASEQHLPCHAPADGIQHVLDREPFDYLFSIVNEHVLPKRVLALPRCHAINYHDAPLPRYAGTHATSWALLEGRTSHGISWHLVTDMVDGGDILKQRTFELDDEETAFSLNARCYEAAIGSFSELVQELGAGRVRPARQDLAQRTFFPRFKRPAGGCLISWMQEAKEVVALVRALDFGPYANALGLPKFRVRNDFIVPRKARVFELEESAPPGTIINVRPSGIGIATRQQGVWLDEFETLAGESISTATLIGRYELAAGVALEEPDAQLVDRASRCLAEVARHEAAWVQRIQAAQPMEPPLAICKPVPASGSKSCLRLPLGLDPGVRDKLQAAFVDFSLTVVVQAVFAAYLARMTQRNRFDIGYSHPRLLSLVAGMEGLFSPVVPLPIHADMDGPLRPLLSSLQAAREAADCLLTFPLDLAARYPALRSLAPTAALAPTPVTLQVAPDTDPLQALPGAVFGLAVSEDSDECHLVFDKNCFDDEAPQRIAGQLRELLRAIALDPVLPLAQLPLLSLQERRQVIVEWNATDASYPREDTIISLFEEQVGRTPGSIAAADSCTRLSYAELNARANKLAGYLRSLGVTADVPVGICIDRSVDMLVGILAILKAGGAYVPLDPGFPVERLGFMLADSRAAVLLTQQKWRNLIRSPGLNVVCTDSVAAEIDRCGDGNDCRKPSADDLAYILYTSGSTGKPKGVEITHRCLTNFLWSMKNRPGCTQDDVLLALTTLSFDIAGLELYLPLICGARVEIASRAIATDGRLLKDFIDQRRPTLIQATPATWQMLLDAGWSGAGIEKALCGGEALPPALAARLSACTASLWNMYGPTETTIWSSMQRLEAPTSDVSIGRPIANTQMYILDAHLQPLPPGVPGELFIGGDGVARGYRNNPELTAERFIAHPFSDQAGARLYRTGDLAFFRQDGSIVHLGRLDFQVKVRGFRIELGEIEAVLGAHGQVAQAVVAVREGRAGEPGLVAYVVPSPGQEFMAEPLREYLKTHLPEYMIPQHFVALQALPLTPNGKIDRARLPAPDDARPSLAVPYAAADISTQSLLVSIWEEILAVSPIGLDDNFFDLGGSSLLVIRMLDQVEKRFNRRPTIGQAFARPTIRQLHSLLEDSQPQTFLSPAQSTPPANSADIAIVGMAGRFPGCRSVAEYWDALCGGRELITFFEEADLHPSIREAEFRLPNYVKARGVVADADCFDAVFFGINAKEADVIDPQQRMLLEIAVHALEDAGLHGPALTEARAGVFAGVGDNEYYRRNLLGNPAVDGYGDFRLRLANEKDFAATRIAYALGIKGAAVNVQTACSTSLVAVSRGMQSLRLGESDIAICGAAHLPVPQNSGHLFNEGSAHSQDGHCRPFDAAATGTVFSSGGAMVVLMRKDEAAAQGRRIYAVLKGAGVNNDGGGKMSFMAPSAEGQARVLAQALADANMAPQDITYVEAHGTATPLGDPIEAEALASVYGNPARPTYLGSVKGNIGHLDAAAGVAGLIKTALALHYRAIPASLNFDAANPRIPLEQQGLVVNSAHRHWPEGRPLCAAVSSLGVGGTNAHVILEGVEGAPAAQTSEGPSLLLFSGKSEQAAATLQDAVMTELEKGLQPSAAASSLAHHRQHFDHRRYVVRHPHAPEPDTLPRGHGVRRSGGVRLAFLFPGQGCQYPCMGQALYRSHQVFRKVIDECSEVLTPQLELDPRALLGYDGFGAGLDSGSLLDQTRYTQPLLFMVGLALARLWRSWGIHADAVAGHSIGEYAAACLAGVMTAEDALCLVAKRGRMMGELAAGAMLSVRLGETELLPLLGEEVDLAAVNGPQLCAVSGSFAAIERLRASLTARQVPFSILRTSHAFHSAMMDPIVDAYEAEVARIRLSPPRIPLLSTVTADWLSDEDAVNPAYWARQLRLPVRFADAVQALWRRDDFLMLELGPRATATTMARRAAWDRPRQIAVPSMGDGIASEQSSLLGAAGHLWACGAALDLEAVIPKEPPASLPGYPFARVRHWIEPHQPAPHTTTAPGSSDELAALQALLAAQRVVLQTQANLLRRQNVLTSDQRIAEQ